MGGTASLQATMLGKVFGRLHYGAIVGRMQPLIIGGQSAAVPLVGWIYDRTASYGAAFGVIIVTTGLASVAIAGVGRTETR